MASYRFTPDTAAAMAAKSLAVRRANREQRERMKANPPLVLPSVTQTGEPLRAEYVNKRIERVRKQIGRLDALFRVERNAQNLDRLANAMSRLSEIERVLSGRPLPGSYRPGGRRSAPTADSEPAEPITGADGN